MENIQQNTAASEEANAAILQKISRISIASFALCLLGFCLTIFNFANSSADLLKNQTVVGILGIIQVASFFISSSLAAIDLLGKDNKKIVSKISALTSGLFILMFIVLLVLLNSGQ